MTPKVKPVFRVSLAMSLDGYIADKKGDVKWLNKFNGPPERFEKFYKTIDTVIVGRRTYDQALSWGTGETNRRTIVITNRPLKSPSPHVETFHGDVKQFARQLAKDGAKQVWLMGGGESIRAFHEAGLVDRWELFIVPVVLGDGVPLFPREIPRPQTLTLTRCKQHPEGVVEVHYEKAPRGK